MGTTLYFATNTASRKEAGTYPVANTEYANLTPTVKNTTEGYMVPYAWRGVANLSVSTGTGTTAKVTRFGRFFSPPFAQDYTYNHPLNSSDAIQYFLADYESNLSANHCVEQCYVYVWRPSTGTKIGVIQPAAVKAPGSKEPTAASSIRSTLGSYYAPSSGSIDILAGDILVFEPFSTYTKSSSTSYTVRFYYGGATEITAENTSISAPASKVVFSVDLPLAPPSSAIASAVNYYAHIRLLGPVFAASLASKARLVISSLSDGSPLTSRLYAKQQVNAYLYTQTLLASSLKSISNLQARVPQTHLLGSILSSTSVAVAIGPDSAVGESLCLYYSGTGSKDNPVGSIGGKRNYILEGDKVTALSSSPGVSLITSHGMLGGRYRVDIDSARREVSLVIVPGIRKFSSGYGYGASVVSVGSAGAGYVVVSIDAAAATTTSLYFLVERKQNTLFLNPSESELTTGSTLYRCLYLFNESDQDVTDVTLQVFTDSTDTVQVASEYAAANPTLGYTNYRYPRSTQHKALDLTGWGGVFYLEDALQVQSELSANSLPMLIASSRVEQASDGVSVQVPAPLADQEDSTGLLQSLSFGPSLQWANIKARKGVTFWVKKVAPPSAGSPDVYSMEFRLSGNF